MHPSRLEELRETRRKVVLNETINFDFTLATFDFFASTTPCKESKLIGGHSGHGEVEDTIRLLLMLRNGNGDTKKPAKDRRVVHR
jgi:hypothetical protein